MNSGSVDKKLTDEVVLKLRYSRPLITTKPSDHLEVTDIVRDRVLIVIVKELIPFL